MGGFIRDGPQSKQVQLPLILPHVTPQPHLNTSFAFLIYANSRGEVKGRTREGHRQWLESPRFNRLGFTPAWVGPTERLGPPLGIRSQSGQLPRQPVIPGERWR